MPLSEDFTELKLPDHWTQEQFDKHIENMRKAGYEVIVATTSEKVFPRHLFNK